MKFVIKIAPIKKHLWIAILAAISFFFPAYIAITNQHNLSFALTEIPMIIYFVSFLIKGKLSKRKDLSFIIILVVYFVVFAIYNFFYLHCYWAMFYKIGSFLLIWIISNKSYIYSEDSYFFIDLEKIIIYIFTISVCISLVAYLMGYDAIICNLGDFYVRHTGSFTDSRLTWVYMHKSGYGLMLCCVLALVLRSKAILKKKPLIILYLVALVVVNSAASIIGGVGVLYANYVSTRKIDKKYIIRFIIGIFAIGIAALLIFAYLSGVRGIEDISSLGDRLLFWENLKYFFTTYPYGMGQEFYSVDFYFSSINYSINNLHNVFLNEMLHYSIPVGILFSVLLLYWPIKGIRKSTNRFSRIIEMISLMLPLLLDQAMNDTLLPIYLIVLYLIFLDRKDCNISTCDL